MIIRQRKNKLMKEILNRGDGERYQWVRMGVGGDELKEEEGNNKGKES